MPRPSSSNLASVVDSVANAGKATCDKAYNATDDVAEEDRVAEAAALAMPWSLPGKEEENHWQLRKTHHRSATRDLSRGEHDEESSAAMQVRADAMAAMLRDTAQQLAEAAAEVAEEDKRSAHWAAELNTTLARREDERRRETQHRENHRRAVLKQHRQQAAI
jgi:hypothetical protein